MHLTNFNRTLSILLLALVIAPYLPVAGAHHSPVIAYYTPPMHRSKAPANAALPLPAPPIIGSMPHFAPASGVLRVAVIAAQFSDINATTTTSQIKQEWSVVNQYYQEASFGTVKLQVDVYGWYTLPYPETYYGKDCLGIDDADCSGSDGSWHIAQDAIALAQHDLSVNNYDYFSFVHSGYGEESSGVKNDVWSVTYLGGVWIQTSGKSITKFSVIPEAEAGDAVPIGVYAHEFGHQLGLPDLYNTQTGRTIMGPWTLMDAGLWNGNPPGSSPSHFDSWCKIQLGWISGSSLAIANSGTASSYSIDPTELPTTNLHAVEVPASNGLPPSQYYLVEVREQIGFDSALPSAGVLILYVDETRAVGRIQVINANPSVSGLASAVWSVGQTFNDPTHNIAIAVTGKAGNSYQIKVSQAGTTQNQNQNQNLNQSAVVLSVTRFFIQPNVITVPNTTVSLLIDVSNQGTLNVSNVPIEISLDGQHYATTQISVNIGSTSEATVTWMSVAGTHLFKATVDPNNTLSETSTTGRVATLQVYVGPSLGPTLIVNVPTTLVSSNESLWVKINGVQYDLNSSQLQTKVPSGTVTLQIQPAVDTSPGTRQAFSRWSDGSTANPRQIVVKNDTQLAADFSTQYSLTVNSNHGQTSPGGWYDANATAILSATTPSNVTANTLRLLFVDWSGDYNSNSSSFAISMTKPVTVQANWITQYYVTVITPTGSPSGEGWYNLGTTANVTIQPLIQFTNGTRDVFIGWNQTSLAGATSLQIRINAPTKLQANWERQYLIQIQSAYGTPEGSGWYNAGSTAQLSVQPEIDYPNRTRRVFNGWTGDYSSPNPSMTVQVNSPKSTVANWVTQYKLTFKISGVPNSTVVTLNIDNRTYQVSGVNYYSGWYNSGQQINPTTNSTINSQVFVYSFAGWHNSTGSIQMPIVVSGPEDYTAQFSTQLTLPPIPGFPIESIWLGIMIGILLILALRRRRVKR